MMTLLRRVAASSLIFLVAAGPASAREVTPDEQAALAERVAAFQTAVVAGDAEAILDAMPPNLPVTIADLVRVTVDEFREQTIAAIAQMMTQITEFSFEMDLDAARYLELSDGTPYALIPTETRIVFDGGAERTTSETLAMLDGDRWYLVRTGSPDDIAVLTMAYPLFAGVEFSEPVSEPIEP